MATHRGWRGEEGAGVTMVTVVGDLLYYPLDSLTSDLTHIHAHAHTHTHSDTVCVCFRAGYVTHEVSSVLIYSVIGPRTSHVTQ